MLRKCSEGYEKTYVVRYRDAKCRRVYRKDGRAFYFYSIYGTSGTRSTNALGTFRWASNPRRATRFLRQVREESQLCGGTLSFVIHGGDRLSAVVRFGSNMSYARRASWRATGRLPRTSRGRPRTIGGCINVKRSRRRKEKNKVIIISTTRQRPDESKGAGGRIARERAEE